MSTTDVWYDFWWEHHCLRVICANTLGVVVCLPLPILRYKAVLEATKHSLTATPTAIPVVAVWCHQLWTAMQFRHGLHPRKLKCSLKETISIGNTSSNHHFSGDMLVFWWVSNDFAIGSVCRKYTIKCCSHRKCIYALGLLYEKVWVAVVFTRKRLHNLSTNISRLPFLP